jgi:AraC-like DNA-binding protein
MIISDILSYIDTHINEQITLESLAREFGYNKSYFSRLFNDHLGISLNNYVNFVRLNRFEQLMAKNSDKSVTELIYEAGFSSTTTFYRAKSYRTKSREK